jgi:23S rRNA pseudouridine955/2504/2580 synthase
MHSAEPKDRTKGVQHVEIGANRDGQRVDNALAALLKGVPRSLIYRLVRKGQVRVNGKRVKPDTRLTAGDTLRVPPVRVAERDESAPPPGRARALNEAVIFEDKHFLVIDKPSGIASHGGSGVDFGAIELLRAARPDETLELVHRLDRETSGVLVLARTRAGLTGLQALIREGKTTKQYLALLTGRPARAKFDVNVPLRKSVLQGGERMVRVTEGGKPSLSFFRQVERYADASLMEVTLDTGRTHQIRVHAAHVGHPVAGDTKYGEREVNQRYRELGLKRLFLHAAHFAFEFGGKAYGFSAPLPPELHAVLDALPRLKPGRRR